MHVLHERPGCSSWISRSPKAEDASFESQADAHAALLDYLNIDYDFAKYAHAHIPNSELIPFPSGEHMLLGQHEQYREVVVGFLKEHL
jgi:hypothetical protein